MAYDALYPPKSCVRIAAAQVLRQYMRPQYKFHHPVESGWLKHAGESHQVASAGMYFGGDIVYVLDGLPGMVWREECLLAGTASCVWVHSGSVGAVPAIERWSVRRMLTAQIIRKWLELRGDGPISESGISSLARHDAQVAEAWEQSSLIDDLIGSARIVKDGLASKVFADELRQRLREETDGPDAVQAIWDAA